MNDAQVGKYMRLLCAQHQHGGFIDSMAFEAIVGTDNVLRSKFKQSEQGFFNERLSEEMAKRKQKSLKMSANAMQKQSKSKAIAKPIENENESVIEIVNKDKGVQGEKDFSWFVSCLDEVFIDNMKAIHKGKNIEQSTKEAFAHMAADANRIRAADQADVKRLVNTWLSNQKVQKNGKGNGTYYDKDKLARLIAEKYGTEGTAEQA